MFNLIYFVVTAVFSWPKASLKNLDENLALSSINNKQKTHLISGCRQLVVPSYHSLNKFKFLVFHTQGTYSVYIHMYVCMNRYTHCTLCGQSNIQLASSSLKLHETQVGTRMRITNRQTVKITSKGRRNIL